MICPHNKEVIAKTRLGVTIYYHLDNKKCNMLNSSKISPDKLNETYLRYHKPNPKSAEIVSTITNKSTQKYICDYIKDAENVEDIADVVKFYFNYFGKTSTMDIFMKALIEYFGKYSKDILGAFELCSGRRRHIIENSPYKNKPRLINELKNIQLIKKRTIP